MNMGYNLRTLFAQRSGNFGHKGRPGLVGGSASNSFTTGRYAFSEEELQAIRRIKASSNEINTKLRSGETLSERELETTKVLDKAFKTHKLKQDIVVYRGANNKFLDKIDKGYTSTSTDMRMALGWSWNTYVDSDSALVEVHVPKGFPALSIDESGIWDRGEREILFPKGLTLKVESQEMRMFEGEPYLHVIATFRK